jgi:hypothetical protein
MRSGAPGEIRTHDLCLRRARLWTLRMMVGLLYMEHGLAKLLGFPLQPNQAPYALFTLNPGLQGLLELVGGLLLALGWFTRHCRLCPRGQHGGRLFHAACAKRFPSAAQRRGVGNRLLLLLCLSGRRRGRMEPRSTTRAGIRIHRIAKPRLSNHHTLAAGWGKSKTVYKPAASPAPRSASSASWSQ